MLRATHVDTRVVYVRVVGLALIGSALVIAAACDGSTKTNQDDTVVPVTTNVPVVDSSAGRTGADVVRPGKELLAEALTAYQDKRYQDAVRLYTAFVGDHERSAWGHYMLGLSLWKSGDLQGARAALEKSVQREPRNVLVLTNLGRVLLESRESKEGLRYAARAVALDPTSHEARRTLARIHGSLNMPNDAIADYRIALSLDPLDAWSMNNLALILIQQQRYEEALAPLARAVQLDSAVAVFQNNLGIALEHTGHFALATVAYQSALDADSSYTKARVSLARVEGRPEDPALAPVVLATLAESFDQEVRTRWMSARVKRDTLPR